MYVIPRRDTHTLKEGHTHTEEGHTHTEEGHTHTEEGHTHTYSSRSKNLFDTAEA